MQQQELRGIPVSHGIAFGKLYIYQPYQIHIETRTISQDQIDSELNRLHLAHFETIRSLQKTKEQALAISGVSIAQIFEAQILLLEDNIFMDQIYSFIRNDLISAETAVFRVMQEAIHEFSNSEDPLIRERVVDVSDVCRRFISSLMGKQKQTFQFSEDTILYARELSPSEMMSLSLTRCVGIILEEGSETSHSAILARVFGIPAIVGIKRFSSEIVNGVPTIINGNSGKVILYPTNEKVQKYRIKIDQYKQFEQALEEIKYEKSETLDHYSICLDANIELPFEVSKVLSVNADGIGLFRTEYLFLSRSSVPSEEEQYQAYFEVATALYPKPVVIRTFDMGGDKVLHEYFTKPEANPFMGFRAIRVSLSNLPLFRTQLRAILRASLLGNVSIMFPMISDIDEVKRIQHIIEEVKTELHKENIPFNTSIPTGIMIEIPSTVIQIREFLSEVDFASIGTNDLTQFTLAVDRNNQLVRDYFYPLHPAILSMIQMVVNEGKRQGKKISICGELAGSSLATLILIALGVDRLSMSPSLIPEIKMMIRTVTREECIQLLNDVSQLSSGKSMEQYLVQKLRKRFANVPIWFGR
ncbi:MAG: phosphoenolpyruvate--protein phosphotransferase [bacterium]|nr:phosphoenolpyruvate--protein phosphotransferase [bacterium]